MVGGRRKEGKRRSKKGGKNWWRVMGGNKCWSEMGGGRSHMLCVIQAMEEMAWPIPVRKTLARARKLLLLLLLVLLLPPPLPLVPLLLLFLNHL